MIEFGPIEMSPEFDSQEEEDAFWKEQFRRVMEMLDEQDMGH